MPESISTDLKLPYGLREGKLYHISEVERGLDCGCVCPACNHPLVAKKGEVKRHHFAHHRGEQCEWAVETALHIAAKDILAEELRIALPAVTYHLERDWIVFQEGMIKFDRVELEHRIEEIRPDIVLYIGAAPLMVEVFVTHGIDESKLKKIRELDISTLEIDISGLDRDLGFAELREIIITDLSKKRWVYNRRADKPAPYMFENIAEMLSAKSDYIPPHRDLVKKGIHGKATFDKSDWIKNIILDCPISKRVISLAFLEKIKLPRDVRSSYIDYWDEGRSFALAWYDCRECDFGLGVTRIAGGDVIVACVGQYAKDKDIARYLKEDIIPPKWVKEALAAE